jgi:hypothetical protein
MADVSWNGGIVE